MGNQPKYQYAFKYSAIIEQLYQGGGESYSLTYINAIISYGTSHRHER